MLKVYYCVIFLVICDKYGGDIYLNLILVEFLYYIDKLKGLNLYLKKYEYISVYNMIFSFLLFFFRFVILYRNNMIVFINYDVVFGFFLFIIFVL